LDSKPLDEEEKKELEGRRRAAELQGLEGVSPVETVSERAELEARRRVARDLFELG